MTQSSTTTESYTYDPVGNRLSSLGVSPYVNNTSNQLTSIPGTTYTYDNNGNTQTKVVGANTTTYAWDYENRLSSVTLPAGGGTVTFKYDPFGRRIYKSSSSGTSVYLYDGPNVAEEVDQTGSVLARYAQDTGIDQVRAELRSGTTSYYEQDGLNSVTSLSNASGALAQTYTFDSFGNQTASSGSLTNPFRYTGRDFDTETTSTTTVLGTMMRTRAASSAKIPSDSEPMSIFTHTYRTHLRAFWTRSAGQSANPAHAPIALVEGG